MDIEELKKAGALNGKEIGVIVSFALTILEEAESRNELHRLEIKEADVDTKFLKDLLAKLRLHRMAAKVIADVMSLAEEGGNEAAMFDVLSRAEPQGNA